MQKDNAPPKLDVRADSFAEEEQALAIGAGSPLVGMVDIISLAREFPQREAAKKQVLAFFGIERGRGVQHHTCLSLSLAT